MIVGGFLDSGLSFLLKVPEELTSPRERELFYLDWML